MQSKLELNIDVNSRHILSAYVEAPFFRAKEMLKEEGFGVISLKENARLRMQEGKDSSISINGNWTREGVIYVPNKGEFLVKESPLLENRFSVADKQLEKVLSNSVEITNRGIPTRRFGEEELTVFAFGKNAGEYGRFLEDTGATLMSVWLKPQDYVNKAEIAFVKQVWFGGLRPYRVGLIANNDIKTLSYNLRLRGLYNYPKNAETRI